MGLREVDPEVDEDGFERLLGGLLGVEARGPFDANITGQDDPSDSQVIVSLGEPAAGVCACEFVTHGDERSVPRVTQPARPCPASLSERQNGRGR